MSFYSLMKNSLILYILLIVVSCSPGVSDGYYQKFYQDRSEKLIGLVSGERVPLTPEKLTAISYYDYNEDFRVVAQFYISDEKEIIEMPTYSGQIKEFVDLGVLKFKVNGEQSELHVFQNVKLATHPVYKNYYFLPFRDLTTGAETYGGGRYIDMKKSDFEQGKVILDFNAAYNPWCAYSDGFNCPIPPESNDLPVAIYAGEKQFQGEVNH